MGIAVPSAFFSVGDLESVKNALQVMYNTQNNKTGAFAESGPPLSQQGSDTYHMWSQIGTYNYVLYTNDTEFLTLNWAKYQLAMGFILGKVDDSGLLNVTGTRDWARLVQGKPLSLLNLLPTKKRGKLSRCSSAADTQHSTKEKASSGTL